MEGTFGPQPKRGGRPWWFWPVMVTAVVLVIVLAMVALVILIPVVILLVVFALVRAWIRGFLPSRGGVPQGETLRQNVRVVGRAGEGSGVSR